MAKITRTTQELINVFPEWAEVRNNDQSVGFQLFNALSLGLSKTDKELEKMKKNQYLATANIDEPDFLYKVQLPSNTDFATITNDSAQAGFIPPTVTGTLESGTEVSVILAEDNNIENFFTHPDRFTVSTTTTGEYALLSQAASLFPYETTLEHHLTPTVGGGYFWVEVSGGAEYIKKNETTNRIERACIVLSGITRKGTAETETLYFAWDEKRHTTKEWKRLTKIDVSDFEDSTIISIRSADFNQEPYISFYNHRYSPNRKKIDEFWQLNTMPNTYSSLARVEYITDQWEQLILGFSDMEIKKEWELLDVAGSSVSGVDCAIQPFTDNLWVVTSDKKLICYDLEDRTLENISLLKGKTDDSEVKINVDTRHILKEEDIVFTISHVRPIREILRYRVWYQTPSGDKYGISNGSQVLFSSDFWVEEIQKKGKQVGEEITIETSEKGEYLIVLEVEFYDNIEKVTTKQIDKVIVSANYKTPLKEIDISEIVTNETIVGVDFDSDQKIWILTTGTYGDLYYRLIPHSDTMLIDYNNKIIYLHENYTNVEVVV